MNTPSTYEGTYFDALGSESIIIINDGRTLKTTIRNITFAGNSFDALSPTCGTRLETAARFKLAFINKHDEQAPTQFDAKLISTELCDYVLTVNIPLPLAISGFELQGNLYVKIERSGPSNKALQFGHLKLTLCYAGQIVNGTNKDQDFEAALLELQNKLPKGTFIKTCINCLYSDYNVYGNGMFGDMMCFRTIKEEYLRAVSKKDFMKIQDRYTEHVQETYLCSDFTRRVPSTGYRG